MGFRRRSIAGALAGLALGLAEPACNSGAFVCESNTQCSANGVNGTCEPTGWCSFPDPLCPSGARYGDHAGGSLAGQCVPPGGATEGGESTAIAEAGSVEAEGTSPDASSDSVDPTPGSNDSGSDPTGNDETTIGPQPVCGNGAVEVGEGCDDSNRVDGDGCNSDCTPSGELLWEIVEDGPAGLADGAASIDIDHDDQVYVGAWFSDDTGPQLAARKLALDGTIAWTQGVAAFLPWDSAYAWGIAVDGQGNAVLAADAISGDAPNWVVAQVTSDGDAGWVMIEGGRAFGVAIDTNVWVSGRTGTEQARIIGYTLDGTELHRYEGNPVQPTDASPWDIAAVDGDVYVVGEIATTESIGYATQLTPTGTVVTSLELDTEFSQALALARGPDEWWVVGSGSSDGGWLLRLSSDFAIVDGPAVVTEAGASANLHGVAFGPAGEAVAVGWQDGDALVQFYQPDATLGWQRTFEGGQDKDDHARDVVIASDGTIVVAGHIGPLTDAGDFWLFALDP